MFLFVGQGYYSVAELEYLQVPGACTEGLVHIRHGQNNSMHVFLATIGTCEPFPRDLTGSSKWKAHPPSVTGDKIWQSTLIPRLARGNGDDPSNVGASAHPIRSHLASTFLATSVSTMESQTPALAPKKLHR